MDVKDIPGFPDVESFLLPARGYARSILELAIPTRKRSIKLAADYAATQLEVGLDAARDFGLLGVFGEVLQTVEDLGNYADSLLNGLPGTAFYAKATAYHRFDVTGLYRDVETWGDNQPQVLLLYRVWDKHILDWYTYPESLPPEKRELFVRAEKLSCAHLRRAMEQLASLWSVGSPFLHAYKHAGIVVAREYFNAVADAGGEGLGVWKRRAGSEPRIHSLLDKQRELLNALRYLGGLAVQMVEILASVRVAMTDTFLYTEDGKTFHVRERVPGIPVVFWIKSGELSDDELEELQRSFGVDVFVEGVAEKG